MQIYFNELSLYFPPLNDWDDSYRTLIKLKNEIIETRSDIRFAYTRKAISTTHNNIHLFENLKILIKNKDQYRRIINRITENNEEDQLELCIKAPQVNTEIDLIGAKLALANNSLIFSISTQFKNSNSKHFDIQIEKIQPDGYIQITNQNLRHLSIIDHVETWKSEIISYGYKRSNSRTIKNFGGYSIVMYPGPKEHNPPHVHLISQDSKSDIAKYRIDVPLKIKGSQTEFHTDILEWINSNKNDLLNSWQHCQLGNHPFNIK